MDIAAISTSMSLQTVQQDVAVAVLDNSLENVEALGEGITKMMEQSVQPYLGANIDYLA